MNAEQSDLDPYKSPTEVGASAGKHSLMPLVVLLVIGGTLAAAAGGAVYFWTARVEEFGEFRRGPVEIEESLATDSPSEAQP
ncbi:MAG: hypothetical protein AAF802_28580 [Planctomycetota bacterium]